ncbi:MAG: hypothetical protein CSB24_01755 [Deltaproteobacteria bacterium]|nr:MAG: hypothetical protein CSB24_01755 [Deltaproteobacteria bacterium]
MAPARMISFMERHAVACSTCLQDAELKGEIAKIKELILPESKIPKAVLAQQQKEAYEASLEDDEEYEDDIDGEDLT